MHQKYFDWKNYTTIKKYYISIFTFAFILSVGIGAMFVRFYVFDKNIEYTQKPIIQEKSAFNVETEFFKESKKGDVEVPSYFTKQSDLRDKYQRSSKVEAEKKASYVTYVVMMMLFFGIQVVGLVVGNRYRFVGKESKEAYKIIHSYKEKREV